MPNSSKSNIKLEGKMSSVDAGTVAKRYSTAALIAAATLGASSLLLAVAQLVQAFK